MSISERLKYARERSGLSGSQVRERTGIGESSLSEFENGKREPSLSQLKKLGDLYRRSVEFFMSEGAIAEPVVLWRKRPPEETAKEIEVGFLRLCEQYHNLEMWCNEPAPACLPKAEGKPERFGYREAEELAKRTRRDLQLGDRPGPALLAVLEEACAVKVFHLDFEPSGTAASTVSDAFGAAVLLNANNVPWRRNHDLAHELFHLLTWPIFRTPDGSSLASPEWEEKLATCFATNLLMPDEPFRSAIHARMRDNKITFEALYDVAREFGVSVESVIWRLHYLFGRGPEESEKTKAVIERAKFHAPPMEDKGPKPELYPERYRALAVKALRHGEISIGRCAQYLGINRSEAARFAEQEAPIGEEVQVTPA